MLSQTGEGLRLGGERRIATVLFSDLRGFTSYAETLPPATVISVLNRYLTLMSDVILDNGGTLVAYMGDGIMAVFGAPIEMDDHADRALRTARHMTGPALQEFNQWMRDQGVGEGFRMGVGLMSGEVMSGNVGSERRLEYTAIGDTTNTAARLEGMTKGQPYMVFVSGTTVKMAQRPARRPRQRRPHGSARPTRTSRCVGATRSSGERLRSLRRRRERVTRRHDVRPLVAKSRTSDLAADDRRDRPGQVSFVSHFVPRVLADDDLPTVRKLPCESPQR